MSADFILFSQFLLIYIGGPIPEDFPLGISNTSHESSFTNKDSVRVLTIELFVEKETPYSTVSRFIVDNGIVSGYIMEREKGVNLAMEQTSGSNKRIPTSTYKVVRNDCTKYYDDVGKKRRKYCSVELRLVTYNNPDAGTRVGILLHRGYYAYNSTGCLMPADSVVFDYEFKRNKTRKNGQKYVETITTDKLIGSMDKLVEISDYVERIEKEVSTSNEWKELKIEIIIR